MTGIFLSLIVRWVVSSVLVLKDRSKPTLNKGETNRINDNDISEIYCI